MLAGKIETPAMASTSKREREMEIERMAGKRERRLYERMERPSSVRLPGAPRGEVLEKCDFSHRRLRGNNTEQERKSANGARELEEWNGYGAANYCGAFWGV